MENWQPWLKSSRRVNYRENMSPGLNCHFVSRFLTTPWEYGQRRLSYFDFDEGRVCSQSSKTLFALRDANTPKVEASLNRLIETPVSQAMAKLTDMQTESEELLEWTLSRALSLLLMLQPTRSTKDGKQRERLEETVMRSDAELDRIAAEAQACYQLGRITVRNDVPLLYPAAGFFAVVAKGKNGEYAAGIAIPVASRHVFVAVRRLLDWDTATTQWAANGAAPVANASVGTSNRVVIPQSAIDALQPEQIAARMHRLRSETRQLLDLAQEFNGALHRLNAEFGLS